MPGLGNIPKVAEGVVPKLEPGYTRLRKEHLEASEEQLESTPPEEQRESTPLEEDLKRVITEMDSRARDCMVLTYHRDNFCLSL